MTSSETTFSVEGMSCAHCEAAVSEAVAKVAGVQSVDVDLALKAVTVKGRFDDSAVRAAIHEAGYEAAA